MKLKRILAVAGLIVALTAMTACGSQDQEETAKDVSVEKETNTDGGSEDEGLNQATSIKIGDQTQYYTAKVALEKGFLADEFGEDFEVELSSFTGGPALTEALVAGQIDFAMYADLPAVQARANNVDIKIISKFWQADDAYSLIAGKDSGIDSLEDLKGKRIAIRVGTQSHKLILSYLKSVGLTGQDVELAGLDTSEGISALATGDVDALIGFTVDNDSIIEQTGGHLVATSEGFDNTVIYQIVNNSYASENPDIVARYLKVLDETNQWISENLEEADQIVADFISSTPEEVEAYWNTRTFTVGWDDNLESEISDTIDFAYEQGTIEEKFDVKELIDTSYLEKAGLY